MVSEDELLLGAGIGGIVLLYSLSRGTNLGVSNTGSGTIYETTPILSPDLNFNFPNSKDVADITGNLPQLIMPSVFDPIAFMSQEAQAGLNLMTLNPIWNEIQSSLNIGNIPIFGEWFA